MRFLCCVQGIHQVETLLESAVDKNFDLFELYVLQNTFAVRDDVNIVLEHHEVCLFDLLSHKTRLPFPSAGLSHLSLPANTPAIPNTTRG